MLKSSSMTISEAPIPLGNKRAPDPSSGDMPNFMNLHPGFRYYYRDRDGKMFYGYPANVNLNRVKETDKLKEIAKSDTSKFLAVELTIGGGGTVGLSCTDLAAADAAEEILISVGFFNQIT